MKISKAVSSFLLAIFALTAVTGLSKASKEGNLLDWVQQHPNALLEYKYPGLQIASASVASSKGSGGQLVTLGSGTAVMIKTTETINSKTAVSGSSFNFRVLGDVIQNGKTLIKAGEMGSAQITSVEKAGLLGKAGSIVISDFRVNAVDGTYVPLQATLNNEGEDKQVLSIIGGLICLFPFLLKGKEGIIPAGTEKTVYTAAPVQIRLH
jgi:hypothetical protein